MPRRYIKFNLPQPQSYKDLFLQASSSDFTLIVDQKRFPLHSEVVRVSKYFKSLLRENKKSVRVQTRLNLQCVEKILGTFYGIQASFQRYQIITYINDILSLMQVQELNRQLQADMHNNFEEYGFFNIFYLSRMLKMKDIQQQCLKQLIEEDYQQINYNRYDLFQLNKELFTFVLKQHQKLKNSLEIRGLEPEQIKAVCEEYEKTTGETVRIQQILNEGKQFEKIGFSGNYFQDDLPNIKKRNATWTDLPNKKKQLKKAKTQESEIRSESENISDEPKSGKSIKKKQLNIFIQQKSIGSKNKIVPQILNQEIKRTCKFNQLDRKLHQFEEKSLSVQIKMEHLKQKMIEMDQALRNKQQKKTNEGHKKVKQNQSKNDQKTSKMALMQRIDDIDFSSGDQF